jgi:four helix bundle protein
LCKPCNTHKKCKIKTVKCKSDGKEIQSRTFEFAVRIVKLCQHLDEKSGVSRTIGKQLLRAGTSVGANVEEAQSGQSKADFISKIAIALKEARETRYWLRLIVASNLLPIERLSDLQTEIEELMKILGAIIVSAKDNR